MPDILGEKKIDARTTSIQEGVGERRTVRARSMLISGKRLSLLYARSYCARTASSCCVLRLRRTTRTYSSTYEHAMPTQYLMQSTDK